MAGPTMIRYACGLFTPGVARRLLTLTTVSALLGGALVMARETGEPCEDGAVRMSIAAIRTAFRTQKPEGLTRILPAGSKVLVALESFEGSAGYYGPDQVYFILRKMFQDLRTIRFDIEMQTPAPGDPPAEPRQTAHCTGTWVYSRREGPPVHTHLHFLLASKNGKWSLMQIREAR
jgi:hypothetical protein